MVIKRRGCCKSDLEMNSKVEKYGIYARGHRKFAIRGGPASYNYEDLNCEWYEESPFRIVEIPLLKNDVCDV